MALFLDTRGRPSLGIALCGRCSKKFPIGDLSSDPNVPGLMVCKDDLDELDPYRLVSSLFDKIELPFIRSDESLVVIDEPDVDQWNVNDNPWNEEDWPFNVSKSLSGFNKNDAPWNKEDTNFDGE